MMHRWVVVLLAVMATVGALVAPSAFAVDSPIGHLGDTLRVEDSGIVADVTLNSVAPSDVPPGFGYPPRAPHFSVYRGQVTVHTIQSPTPSAMVTGFEFRGITLTGDSYLPRKTDAPDALQYALLNAPNDATVSGGVWWDCYRDTVSTVALMNPKTGAHLAQWSLTEALP